MKSSPDPPKPKTDPSPSPKGSQPGAKTGMTRKGFGQLLKRAFAPDAPDPKAK